MAKLGIFGTNLLLLSSGKVGKIEKYFFSSIGLTQTLGKIGKVGDIFELILLLLSSGKVGKVGKVWDIF